MRQVLTSYKKKGATERDTSVVVSFIIYEKDSNVDLLFRREEGSISGGKVKQIEEESLEFENISIGKIIDFVDLIESWIQSETKPRYFDEFEGVEGEYTFETNSPFDKTTTSEYSFDEVDYSVGKESIEFTVNTGDENRIFSIPSSGKYDHGNPLNFDNVTTLSQSFYDFFNHRYSDQVSRFETASETLPDQSAIEKVEHIFSQFGKVARQLEERDRGRDPVLMNDEYDVQYLLHALLRLHFSDVRDESYLKEHAGKSPRIDFLLEDEKIGIETKRLGSSRRSESVRNELAEDKEQYRSDHYCNTLLCFIYDPERILASPAAFEKDLSESTANLTTRVTVTQN